jgi:hypothetical protein
LFESRLSRDAERYFVCRLFCAQILRIGLNTKLSLLHQLDAFLPQELNFKLQLFTLLIELSPRLNQLLIFLT